MTEPLFGQCACGASLTAEHLWQCPLQKRQRAYEEAPLAEAVRAAFERLQAARAGRFDTSHVAVLGEN